MATETYPYMTDDAISPPNNAYADFPCCGSRVTLPTDTEHYQRRCPKCGKDWVIVRTTVRVSGPARVDSVTWEYTQTVHGATGTRQKRRTE